MTMESKRIANFKIENIFLFLCAISVSVFLWLISGSLWLESQSQVISDYLLIEVMVINILWVIAVVFVGSLRRETVRFESLQLLENQKFKMAVDGVADHVVITDPEGKIIYANLAAEKMTGYGREEMIGNKPSLWGKQMDQEFYKSFWKTIKFDKLPFVGEFKNKRKNGEIYDAESDVSPILDENGEIAFFVGIERDISKAKAIDKMKSEFVSLASHQLRTPLSAVKWFGEMLINGDAGELTKSQKEYLGTMIESNEREISIVNSLLNVSRIESGKIMIAPKMTDLKELVGTIISEVKVASGNEQRDISFSATADVPKEVMIDPDLIRHVYTNLLNNSIRYTDREGMIKVTLEVQGGEIVSSVSDDGIGVPEGEKLRVFEKFFRATNALKKYTDGNGLGLYLVKAIITSSGGRVWFENNLDKGTTFMFTLPIEGMRPKDGAAKLD